MTFLESLTSLFAPDDCLGCGREGLLLCRNCSFVLPPPVGQCFGCAAPVAYGAACSMCLDKCNLGSLTAASAYTGISQALIARLKFSGNQSAAKIMATHIDLPMTGECVLVHVPATAAHIRERGYDQAQLIVRHMSRLHRMPRLSALRRSGSKHQLGASRQQRLVQMRQSLHVVRPTRLRGRHIILVDDVLTTGATLRTAATVLLAAGAARVDAVVFAQAAVPREGL